MSKFQSPLLNFGEALLAKESGFQEGKLGSSWDLGIWLGRSTRTSEHLCTRDGVIKARTVKRRPETLKSDRELNDAMNFVPWLIDGPVMDEQLRSLLVMLTSGPAPQIIRQQPSGVQAFCDLARRYNPRSEARSLAQLQEIMHFDFGQEPAGVTDRMIVFERLRRII